MRLKRFNCMHIEDYEIQKEYMAYYITQTAILDWIKDNFDLDENRFENPKIENYLVFAEKSKKLNLKESMSTPFNLSRSEWDELISYLKSKNLLVRNSDNSLMISGNTTSDIDI